MKKLIIASVLTLSMTLTASLPVFVKAAPDIPAAGTGFNDISGHWAEGAIEKYADRAVFSGQDGKFQPDKAITRSEFVLMLHKALDIKIKYAKTPDIKEFFEDVENQDAGARELYDLVVSDTIDRKGLFKPKEALPRDEMVHYVINALKNVTGGNYAIIKMMPAPFADDDRITPAYKNDIVEAVLLKIINGKGGNMLYPQNGSTRAEAAVVIDRLMKTIASFKEDVEVKPSVETDGSSLKLKLSITNNSGEQITINHSSGQKYDFALLDAERNSLYRWSADKMFIAALTTTTIGAGETAEFTEELSGDFYNGIKDRVAYMTAYITGDSSAFNVNPEGYEVPVK